MSKIKRSIFLTIPAFLFISIEIIRTLVRPVYGQKKYGVISTILGWLPNLIAGIAILSLGTVIVYLISELSEIKFSKFHLFIFLLLLTSITLMGLIWHEIAQKGTGLFYDINDIRATIAGVAIGILFYCSLFFRKGILVSPK